MGSQDMDVEHYFQCEKSGALCLISDLIVGGWASGNPLWTFVSIICTWDRLDVFALGASLVFTLNLSPSNLHVIEWLYLIPRENPEFYS